MEIMTVLNILSNIAWVMLGIFLFFFLAEFSQKIRSRIHMFKIAWKLQKRAWKNPRPEFKELAKLGWKTLFGKLED